MARPAFRVLMTGSSLLAAVTSIPAFSQTSDGAPGAAESLTSAADGTARGEEEAIIVTGSRLARTEFSQPNPIQSFTAAAIEQSGDTNITDFLLDSPALVGSLSNELNSGSNTNTDTVGLNLLDLRNLGTDRTLVLIDGRRQVNSFSGANSVDTNTIPIDLIERVDVLTGGASAIYGADGVSGVVNFVMKRDFEGLRARGQIGISQRGDNGNRFGSIVAGKNFADGRGNVAIAYEYNVSDRFDGGSRSYLGNPSKRYELLRDPGDSADDPNRPDRIPFNNVSWSDSAPNGAVDVDLDGVPDFDGDGRPYNGGTFIPGSGGRAINGPSNTPTAGYFGDLAPYIKRQNVNFLSSFAFSDAFKLSADAKYSRNNSMTIIQPSFDFFTYLTPDNAYLNDRFGTQAPDGAYLSRDNFDLGRQTEIGDRKLFRGVLAAEGEITSGESTGNIHYEISYVYGEAKAKITSRNSRLMDRYFAALDAVRGPDGNITCRINLPGESIIDQNNYAGLATIGGNVVSGLPLTFSPGECVPLNLLGQGVASRQAIDFVMVDSVARSKSTENVISGSVRGDLGFLFNLPGGPIQWSIGGEYRKEKTSSTPSLYSELGVFEGGAQVLPSGGKFDVKEIFGEVEAPILTDLPFAKTLSVGGAVRFSDYSTIGKTTTWKIDGAYAPIADITFRGTYSQAVRAPNISELFSPLQGSFEFLDDPCDPSNIKNGSQFRAANCQTLLAGLGLTPQQIADFSPSTDAEQSTSKPGLSGGNRNLREETAKTWTAGVVLRPRFIPGLTMSADWYDISLKNAINTATANEVLDLCVDQPSLQNLFCPNVVRDPKTGFVTTFTVQAENVAKFATSGLDLLINYQVSTAKFGRFNLRVVGGYLHDLTFFSTVGADPNQDRGEQYKPKYIGTADLTWVLDKLTVNYGLSWQSRTLRYKPEEIAANPDYAAAKYLKLKERWEHDINVSLDVDERFTIYAGVNNFTDQKPAFAFNAGYPVSAVGRYFYAGAKVQLADLF